MHMCVGVCNAVRLLGWMLLQSYVWVHMLLLVLQWSSYMVYEFISVQCS